MPATAFSSPWPSGQGSASLQGLIKHVQQAFPDLYVVTCADDFYLQGPPASAIGAFCPLVAAFTWLLLHMLRGRRRLLGSRLLSRTAQSSAPIATSPPLFPLCPCRWSPAGGPRPCRCSGPGLMRRCRLVGLIWPARRSSQGIFGSCVVPFAAAMPTCVARVCTLPQRPLARPCCAGSPGPPLRSLGAAVGGCVFMSSRGSCLCGVGLIQTRFGCGSGVLGSASCGLVFELRGLSPCG
jgi:hypothetical protein